MATRLYFAGSETVTPTPSTDAAWSSTTGFLRRLLLRAKYASPSAIAVGSTISWANTAGTKALDRQYISPPLAAQTISGTVSIMASVRMRAGTDNVDRALCSVRVIDSSGTVVATLLAHGLQTGATTATFLNNATCRSTVFANAAGLSSYSCSAGDRLVVEMGFSNSTAGTTPQGATKWGENATDATLGDTTTTANRAAWIEFSANLTWAAPTVTSVSANTGSVGGGKSVTVTGTGFYNGATTVAFGSNNATSVVVTSSTTLTCVVPAATSFTPGAVNVTVTNADGQASSALTNGFTYDVPGLTESVFLANGGLQIVMYEAFAGGSYVDSMGVGSTFNQPNSGNQPTPDTTISLAGRTLLGFDGNDLTGDFGTGGIIPSSAVPAWSGSKYFIEHCLIYLPATPDNINEQHLIDLNGDNWNRNQFGAGIVYRSGANSNAGLTTPLTPYFLTIEHNVATGVSTMTVQGVAQSATGTNSSATRTEYLTFKLIGAKGDLSDGFIGHFGGFGIGWATTWGSTQRAALYQAQQDWLNGHVYAAASVTLDDVTTTADGTVGGAGGVSADANITFDDVTTTSTASVADTAALNKTLDDVTTTATGAVADRAAADITLADVTTTSAASVRVNAAASITLDDVTVAAQTSLCAQLSTTLGDVTTTAAGSVADTASASLTLGDVTTTSTASVADTAAASITLGDVTTTAIASVTNRASASVTLGDATTTAVGSVAVNAAAAIALEGVTTTAVATGSLSAVAALTLADVTTTAAASVANRAAASATLGDVTTTAAASLPLSIAASITLDDITTEAEVTTSPAPAEFDAALTLDGVTASSTASVAVTAALSRTLADVTSTAAASVAVTATLNKTLGDVTAGAAATLPLHATASLSVDDITTTATGSVRVRASAAPTLDDVTVSAEVIGEVGFSASLALDDVTTTAAYEAAPFAAADITLDGVTTAAAASVAVRATLSKTLGDVTTTAIAALPLHAAANITLDVITSSIAVSAANRADLATTLDDVTAVATYVAIPFAMANLTLDDITAAGTVSARISASLTKALDDVTTIASAISSINAAANITLDNITTEASDSVLVRASLIQTLDDVTVTATAANPVDISMSVTLGDVTASAVFRVDPIPSDSGAMLEWGTTMLKITNLKVRSLDVDFNELSWKIENTAEDVLDYTFEVLRSESAGGPWDKLAKPFKDRFLFYDRFTRPFHALRSIFYVLRVTHIPSGARKDYGPVQQEAEADLIAQELRRHMALLFREFTGRRCWLLPVRTFGQRCPACWHEKLQKRTRSGCASCFDTSFARGFLHPIEVFTQIDPQDTKHEQVTPVGTTHQLNTRAKMFNIGAVKPRDILVEAENIRWRVVAVNQTEQVRAPIHFELQLHRIPQSDIEYGVPIQLNEALRDLWLSPSRNFTNPQNLENFEDEEIPQIFSLYGTTYTEVE